MTNPMKWFFGCSVLAIVTFLIPGSGDVPAAIFGFGIAAAVVSAMHASETAEEIRIHQWEVEEEERDYRREREEAKDE